MASTDRSSGAWVRIAFAIFAVGWGANRFSRASSRSRGRLEPGRANGVAVQPLARRMRDMLSGSVAALGCATAGAAIGVAAVAGANRVVASAAAVLLGLAYGLCLVSGLRQAEHLADPAERGAVIACYYALAHLGSVVPYLVDGLGALAGRPVRSSR